VGSIPSAISTISMPDSHVLPSLQAPGVAAAQERYRIRTRTTRGGVKSRTTVEKGNTAMS
jgi:hypothetical protein